MEPSGWEVAVDLWLVERRVQRRLESLRAPMLQHRHRPVHVCAGIVRLHPGLDVHGPREERPQAVRRRLLHERDVGVGEPAAELEPASGCLLHSLIEHVSDARQAEAPVERREDLRLRGGRHEGVRVGDVRVAPDAVRAPEALDHLARRGKVDGHVCGLCDGLRPLAPCGCDRVSDDEDAREDGHTEDVDPHRRRV